MLRHSVTVVIGSCLIVVGIIGCRSAENTSETPRIPETTTPRVPQKGEIGSADVGAPPIDPEDHGSGQLPDAEIEARMRRPIEESVYDPTLSKDEKLDLLLRHYHRDDNIVTEPDDLFRVVMSEGLTDLEAAQYWAVQGGKHEWAVYYAEAALRSDPGSVEALALWARELPPERITESEAAFLVVLERDPTHREALVRLAGATMIDQPFESMEYANRLIDVYPDSGRGYLFMGQAQERLGDHDAAAAYYEAGLKVAPDDGSLRGSLVYLNSGRSGIQPIEAAPVTVDPSKRPGAPALSSTPARKSPPDASAPRAPRPEPPPPPAPPQETPEPVAPYQNALNDYRELADLFEGNTGETYRGIQDFDGYAKESSNWMAWRYMELERQYLDEGHLEEAEKVRESAEEQFPDDPLIRQRGQQRGRERGEQRERSR